MTDQVAIRAEVVGFSTSLNMMLLTADIGPERFKAWISRPPGPVKIGSVISFFASGRVTGKGADTGRRYISLTHVEGIRIEGFREPEPKPEKRPDRGPSHCANCHDRLHHITAVVSSEEDSSEFVRLWLCELCMLKGWKLWKIFLRGSKGGWISAYEASRKLDP